MLALCLWLTTTLLASADAATLDELRTVTLSEHPALAASNHRSEAAGALVESAGAWSDPMVSVELSNLSVQSLQLGGHGMSGVQLKAQQQLRLPGWSAKQRTVSELDVKRQAHATEELQVELLLQLETAWWEVTRTRLQQQLVQAHVARARELLTAVHTRYETGRAGQHSVLRLQVLHDRLVDDLDDLAHHEHMWAARLSALVVHSDVVFDTPSDPAEVSAPTSLDTLVASSASRPTQHRLAADAERLEASAALARAESRPDPTVWAGYRLRTINTAMDSGDDLVSLGVGLPIPTGSRQRAHSAEAAALAQARAARASADADLDTTRAQLEVVVAHWSRSEVKARTYARNLIPAAQAALDTTLSEFAVGKADFSSLFDAEVMLLELERARVDAIIETHLAESTARALTGASLPGAPQ